MSKRKRSSTPEPDEPTDDASVKDDMVHVTSDMLSGSPDSFAGKKSESEPAAEPEPKPEEAPVEPTEARTTLAAAETTESESSTPAEDTSPTQVTAEPVAAPPPYASAEAQPARQHRGGST